MKKIAKLILELELLVIQLKLVNLEFDNKGSINEIPDHILVGLQNLIPRKK